jgi:hypothetical protein
MVLFTDAFDSVVLAPLEAIVERFLELGSPVVMSAERVCWPDPLALPLHGLSVPSCR